GTPRPCCAEPTQRRRESLSALVLRSCKGDTTDGSAARPGGALPTDVTDSPGCAGKVSAKRGPTGGHSGRVGLRPWDSRRPRTEAPEPRRSIAPGSGGTVSGGRCASAGQEPHGPPRECGPCRAKPEPVGAPGRPVQPPWQSAFVQSAT